jgi:membrane protease YdiL (CAAX protease family)
MTDGSLSSNDLEARMRAVEASNPEVVVAMGFLVLLAVFCFIWLLVWWIRKAARKESVFDRVEALPVPWTWLAGLMAALAGVILVSEGLGRDDVRALFMPTALVVPVLMMLGVGVKPDRQWSHPRFPITRALGLGIILGLASFVVIVPVALVQEQALSYFNIELTAQEPVEEFFQKITLSNLLDYALLVVVIAPVAEEILFRGFLHPVLKQWLSWRASVLVIAALFAMAHLHLGSALPLFLLGILLGLAYEATHSLVVSIGIHATFNAVQLTQMIVLKFLGGEGT